MTVPANDALFRRVLGAAIFDALPSPLQRLHLRGGTTIYRGEVEVTRGGGMLSRICAWATRLPGAGTGPIAVEIAVADDHERWVRRVGRHAMASRLWANDGVLRERLGLVTFDFRLAGVEGDIVWTVVGARVLGMPMPARWFAHVRARESVQAGRYRFEVSAALPLAGPLVHYRGWLDVD